MDYHAFFNKICYKNTKNIDCKYIHEYVECGKNFAGNFGTTEYKWMCNDYVNDDKFNNFGGNINIHVKQLLDENNITKYVDKAGFYEYITNLHTPEDINLIINLIKNNNYNGIHDELCIKKYKLNKNNCDKLKKETTRKLNGNYAILNDKHNIKYYSKQLLEDNSIYDTKIHEKMKYYYINKFEKYVYDTDVNYKLQVDTNKAWPGWQW